ncbi:MAG: glycosyltransferase family 4 protein [Terracidiphilus sp.]
MKILHVISSGGMYGAEAVILNMSRMMNEGPNRSLLGVFQNFSNSNVQLHEQAIQEGIESHLIPCRGQVDRAAVIRIRELVAQTGVDVVHAHGYKADIYVYLAMRSSRIPFVSTCHNWLDNDRKASLYGFLDRWTLRRYARIVAVSADVRQRLLKAGVDAKRISMIRNGIDLRPFDHAPALLKHELGWTACLLVGLAGRLSFEKGVDIFLHAAARVLAQLPDAKFVVAGDGPEQAALDALINELGIRASVRMLGRRTDMPSFYASLDVLVSSSRTEGLPIGILEAMASRLPLVATPVGEIPTLIEDGRTGMLAAVENQESLAEAIVVLLRNPERREQLGAAARQRVEDEFSAARMTADYLRVYEDALAAVAIKKDDRRREVPDAPRGETK